MRNITLVAGLFVALVSLESCGLFTDSPSENKSSSSVSELSSSSFDPADSGRVEWDYADTLLTRDTLSLMAPDSQRTEGLYRYFIGRLPMGSQVRLSVRPTGFEPGAQFRIKTELGQLQLPILPSDSGTYKQYHSSLSSSWKSNSFAMADTGYSYLEVVGTRDTTADSTLPDFQAFIQIDTAYFAFTGVQDSLEIPANGELRGFFRLDGGEDSTHLYFSAGTGTNLTLTSDGEFLDQVWLGVQGGTAIDSATSRLRYQLLPSSQTTWRVRVRSVVPSWTSGNYALFTLRLSSIALGQGEYLERPDTLTGIGDTMLVSRTGTENSGWDVRHDHYILLGTYQAGDSLRIWYGSQGMANVQKHLRILNAQGEEVQTLNQIHTLNWKSMQPNLVAIAESGVHYLHYTGMGNTNTYWMDPNWTLRFQVMVQKPGSLTSWSITPDSIQISVGDTLNLDTLVISHAPEAMSGHALFSLLRSERGFLQDSLDIAAESSGFTLTGNSLGSGWLKAKAPGTANLILQSVADPRLLDTCVVSIIP